MDSPDAFGLDREKKILRSGVRDVFTPHQPINSLKLFFGRKAEVQSLMEQMNTPGQHALLYGERGVGKTSLANVAAIVLKELAEGRLFQKRCDSTDTFATVVANPLQELGFDVNVSATQKTTSVSGEVGVNMAAKATVERQDATVNNLKGIDRQAVSPSWVAEQLQKLPALFVVDEADAIASDDDRRKLSELIKHLSDAGSHFKILVVGIAETAQSLTGGHPSVHRCLRETKLDRMSQGELADIVIAGAERLGLHFSESAVNSILNLSAGYPHFTHLLALKCAEEAIANGSAHIELEDLQHALGAAAQDAEGTLKRVYDDAVRSYQSDMYKVVIGAAAYCTVPEFSAKQLRGKIQERYNRVVSQPTLNNYFQRLVSDTEQKILRRLAKGVYRFTDPRMPSYVRIVEGSLQ
jgi:Cdc6-like AAA superfamily ATPase